MRSVVAGILVLVAGAAVLAQSAGAPEPNPRPFQILDNSYLVEEAFNQDPGVVQNIFGFMRLSGAWAFSFTQEWPVPRQTHQLSYTLAVNGGNGVTSFGDVLVNYRYQVMRESPSRPAFAPRISIILPTAEGRVTRTPGVQVNLPFSKQAGDVYFHWNGGFTALPTAPPAATDTNTTLFSPQLAASAIWRMRPMFHVMLESVYQSEHQLEDSGGTGRANLVTVSPGFRTGWNVGSAQIIWGAAAPVTFGNGNASRALFLYFSYESRIWKAK